MTAGNFSKIRFGDGLAVTDEGGGVITVASSGGGTVDISGKVDRDAVEAATARLVAVKLAAADTQPAFRIDGNGTHRWGVGGTSASDTTLARNGVGVLQVNDNLWVNGNDFRIAGAAAAITFYSDANLYRSATATLQTDSKFYVNNPDFRVGGSTAAVTLGSDTNLYRAASGVLKTDGKMAVSRGADLTISGGAITVTNWTHRISGPVGGVTLSTINGGVDGQMLMLFNRTDSAITLATGGNIRTAKTIPDKSCALFVYVGVETLWWVIS